MPRRKWPDVIASDRVLLKPNRRSMSSKTTQRRNAVEQSDEQTTLHNYAQYAAERAEAHDDPLGDVARTGECDHCDNTGETRNGTSCFICLRYGDLLSDHDYYINL